MHQQNIILPYWNYYVKIIILLNLLTRQNPPAIFCIIQEKKPTYYFELHWIFIWGLCNSLSKFWQKITFFS